MKYLLLLLFCLPVHADVIELQEVNIDTIRFFDGGVDPLVTQNGLPNRNVDYHFELALDTNILEYIYWDNKIHSDTDRIITWNGDTVGGQFRTIGLEFHLGLNISDNLKFGYYHHSVHLLDTHSAQGDFPREDGLEMKFILYKSKTPGKGLF